MISDVRQITMTELRGWAHDRGVEIIELDSPDLSGNRIFSATCGHETRIAKLPPDEPKSVRDAWDTSLYRQLMKMTDVQFRRRIFQRLVYTYPGPQTRTAPGGQATCRASIPDMRMPGPAGTLGA